MPKFIPASFMNDDFRDYFVCGGSKSIFHLAYETYFRKIE